MSSPTSGAGEFRLDVEKAQEAMGDLLRVHGQLNDLKSQALDVARTPRTAMDAVSVEATALLVQRAAGGPGSLAAAVEGAIKHVEDLMAQMEADVAEQERIDTNAARAIIRS